MKPHPLGAAATDLEDPYCFVLKQFSSLHFLFSEVQNRDTSPMLVFVGYISSVILRINFVSLHEALLPSPPTQ